MAHNAKHLGEQPRVLPTLGLLPVLAVSAVVASAAEAETPPAPENLGTITLDGAQAGGEAASSYKVTEGQARTLTAPLLDTPRTVRVVTQRQIEERGAASVEDILRTTPGVTLGTGEGGTPYGTRPYIRGYEAAFSMAVDGVRSRGRTTYEAFNIETVEVNLGSDGVTTGAGAGGGSINMNTKNPIMGENSNRVSATLGNGDKGRLSYDGNYAFSETVAGRLNLLVQDSGVAGSPFADDNKKGFAPALAIELSPQTKLTFKGQYLESDGVSDHRVPMANAAWNTGGAAGAAGYVPYGTGTKSDPYLPIESITRDAFYGVVGRDMRAAKNTNLSLRLDHAFNDAWRMNAQLSYGKTENHMIVSRPSVSYSGGRYTVARDGNGGVRLQNKGSETLNLHLNVAGEVQAAGLEHRLSFGLDAARDRIMGGSTPTLSAVGTTPLFAPNPYAAFKKTGDFGPLINQAQTDTLALYLFDTVTLSENWLLNGGVRIEDYKVKTIEADPVVWDDTLVDYQLGVIYKPRTDLSIYASYNTTSTPPGACVAQGGSQCPEDSLDVKQAQTKAEKTKNFELGVKWDAFGGDLSFTAAIYKNEKDNQRVLNENGDYELAGNSRGQGVDLAVMGRVTDRWEVVAGYSYLDAKTVTGGMVNTGTTARPVYTPDPDVGNRPVNTAEHTFSLWTSYQVDEAWTLGGGANYVSQKYVNSANTAAMPAYWRLDVMANYKVSADTSLQLNINNLLDERYYDSSHVGSFATLQPGRAVSLTLNHAF